VPQCLDQCWNAVFVACKKTVRVVTLGDAQAGSFGNVSGRTASYPAFKEGLPNYVKLQNVMVPRPGFDYCR
jgi:hypothetical protein